MAAEHAAEFVSEAVDVVVVGAGPAGMSAATRAARAGLSVVLLDEQDAVGGQIYRAIGRADARRKEILGPTTQRALRLPTRSRAPARGMSRMRPCGRSRASGPCTI
ncbi:hypothetical protein PPGU19_064260 (plasmid) [Paraburkholderia sp. PGU19]|nr:hypothetical protein PPGU19_064260 [Paraburkholderia sp. PGU19]